MGSVICPTDSKNSYREKMTDCGLLHTCDSDVIFLCAAVMYVTRQKFCSGNDA